MHLNKKTLCCVLFLLAALGLAACSPATPPPQAAPAASPTAGQMILPTSLGEFAISSVRLADEVNGQPAQPGQKILLVTLAKPNLEKVAIGQISLEDFQKFMQENSSQIHVALEDGSTHISTMAGWVEDDFTIGFQVPQAASYRLNWPGIDPITLQP